MKGMKSLAAVGALLGVLTACDLNILNQDDPSLETLEEAPAPAIIYSTAQGLLDAWRSGDVAGGENGWLQDLSCFGREGFYLAPARTILDEFDDALVPSGGLGWANTYSTIRNINSLLHAVEAVGPSMSDDRKEGVRGWAKTIEATLLLRQIRIQDDFGIPIDTDRPRDELTPIATKQEVYAYIFQRYDEAKTHLQNAGSSFGFKLSSGFSGFDTPSSFLKVNRALKARAANDIGDVATTMAALTESFVSPTADMALGAYHSWSTAAGDALMPISDPQGVRYFADTTLATDAQSRANGDPDLRLTTKTALTAPITNTGVTSNLKWRLYADPSSPSPIIKNEELLLIRAEAALDTDAALADINTVRTRSGGLEPIALAAWQGMSREDRVTELLYNRRYSLVWEWGHRWVDMRRFGRLHDLEGPRGAGDRVFDKVPFPEDECITRDFAPEGCQTVEGFRTAR